MAWLDLEGDLAEEFGEITGDPWVAQCELLRWRLRVFQQRFWERLRADAARYRVYLANHAEWSRQMRARRKAAGIRSHNFDRVRALSPEALKTRRAKECAANQRRMAARTPEEVERDRERQRRYRLARRR